MLISIFLIIPLITAVACVLIKKHNVSKYISVTGSFALLLYNIYLGYTIYLNHSLTELNGFFYVDALSLLTAQIVSVVGFAAALYSIGYMDAELHAAEFPEKKVALVLLPFPHVYLHHAGGLCCQQSGYHVGGN